MISVKVIADSMSPEGERLSTLQVKFHRYILPEFNTHRVFSRNFSSSRAIPTKKLLEQVRLNPAIPLHFGKNQPGMQAFEELDGLEREAAERTWKEAAREAASFAAVLSDIGLHKQQVNRIIEPFLYVEGIVSSTEWDNFFGLRAHPDAQPEIQDLAYKMIEALEESDPVELEYGQWHLPYVSEEEKYSMPLDILRRVSSARCCRVSYLKHDGSSPSVEEDINLCNRLMSSKPIHASPFEHVATPIASGSSGNFTGWLQYRKMVEAGKF